MKSLDIKEFKKQIEQDKLLISMGIREFSVPKKRWMQESVKHMVTNSSFQGVWQVNWKDLPARTR